MIPLTWNDPTSFIVLVELVSTYQTDDGKYECRTGPGPFEGFFVSSVQFCKHVKFYDDRKNHTRENNNVTDGGVGTPNSWDECFNSIHFGSPLPPDLRDDLDRYIATTPVVVDDAPEQVVRGVQGLCDLINSEDGIPRVQITTILTNAFLLSGMLNNKLG